MTLADQPQLSGSTGLEITMEAAMRIPPGKGKVKYGPDELAFRKQVEAEIAAQQKAHPGTIVDVRD